jgi:hypothetical protein
MADIVCREIPVNQWSELILQLIANVTNPYIPEHMKESMLEAICHSVNIFTGSSYKGSPMIFDCHTSGEKERRF